MLLLKKIAKVIRDPKLLLALINAQVRIRGRARTPISVRLMGKIRLAGLGKVVFGEGVTLTGTTVPIEFLCHAGGRIEVGDHTYFNYGTSITAYERVSIGRHCHFGHYVLILDNSEHTPRNHAAMPPSKPVVIEDHVWIGSRAIILPGVHIGQNTTVGAGSVVTKSIPPGSVAVGNPARVVRRLVEQSGSGEADAS
jgi:acetyltransferase-like isoleucine patch superfamily enzyme